MSKVVAELSANHGGDFGRALGMIAMAAKCGCDYVKIQTYTPDDMPDKENRALYKKCQTPREWYPQLFDQARRYGMTLFSSVFSPWAIDFLEQFNCPIYKIASPESTRLPWETYSKISSRVRLKPLWFSSGWRDMRRMSIHACHHQTEEVMFFCKSGYPATVDEEDYRKFESDEWGTGYWVPSIAQKGFSDHTVGLDAAREMLKRGAQVIERHFKITDDCVDAAFSSDPDEMKKLCEMAHA